MKSSNSLQPFVPNKKLIIHFDVDNVLRINHVNKDLFVPFKFTVRCMNCVQNGSGVNCNEQARTIPIKSLDGNWLSTHCQ